MDYILQSRRSKRRNNSYLLWNKGYFLFFVHIKYAHFFKLFLGLFELNVHNAHTKRCDLRSYYLIKSLRGYSERKIAELLRYISVAEKHLARRIGT